MKKGCNMTKNMNYLNDNEKWRLSVFLKRLDFNTVYECADSDTHENMKAQAYRTLAVVEKVQNELALLGFAPR